MKTITVSEAQQRLPELVRLVSNGEEFQLTQQQRCVAKLTSAASPPRRMDCCESWTKTEGAIGEEPGPSN
jgi:antitoxin (DNA-binding transcriptional repressor) of toxin-antitoxin stability system